MDISLAESQLRLIFAGMLENTSIISTSDVFDLMNIKVQRVPSVPSKTGPLFATYLVSVFFSQIDRVPRTSN